MLRPLATLLLIAISLAGCTKSEDIIRLSEIEERLYSGQYDLVVEDLNAYLRDYPESSHGWNTLGWTYIKTDRIKEGEACFQKSISLNPESDNAYVGLGAMNRILGNTDKARQNYMRAISIVPENPEAYASLVAIELMEGNYNKAVEYGELAWDLRKDYGTIPANLAIAYHYAGNEAKRDEYFEHAKRLNYHNLTGLKEVFSN
ncbi:MAG: tetratricopeptide repeat protein [Verrucomicrobiota bacterium]